MKISLGYSPCPNDTYMFAALVNGWIDTAGFEFDIQMHDVETLNDWAGSSRLDVTKISFNRALQLSDQYKLLSSGAALGNGCGPLLIARQALGEEAIISGPVALPGQWTTAHLLFRIFYPDADNKVFMPFSEIEEAVLSGRFPAGVIIHENRFTYEAKGLVKLADLGEKWEEMTQLPIPLGGIFASTRLSADSIAQIEVLLMESILFARQHPEKVMDYVRQYAQEMDDSVMKSHIALYVNDFSVDLGEKGRLAVEKLKNFAG